MNSVKDLRFWLAVFLLFPLFVLPTGEVFRADYFDYPTGGQFLKLPLPISIFTMFFGIIILRNFRQSSFSFLFLGSFVFCMLLSSFASTLADDNLLLRKFVLIAQFCLPALALSLGERIGKDGVPAIAEGFLAVLLLLVPAHFVCSWLQSNFILVPSLYLFSIYQHLQYAPVVLLSAYFVSLFVLWGQSKSKNRLLVVLGFAMGVYVLASTSRLAIILFFIGIAVFRFSRFGSRAKIAGVTLALAVSGIVLCSLYFWLMLSGFNLLNKMQFGRGEYWSYFLNQIIATPSNFVWGSPDQPDRSVYPSAHNYYLDLWFHFGLLTVAIIFFLVGYTFRKLVQFRKQLKSTPALLGLTIVIMFALTLDNGLKVSLRQPYPGIFTFFLWGILLTFFKDDSKFVGEGLKK